MVATMNAMNSGKRKNRLPELGLRHNAEGALGRAEFPG